MTDITAALRISIPVQVRQWQDTDAHREAFCTWFDEFDHDFETLGPIVILPDGVKVHPGQYIMLIDSDFYWVAGAVVREAQEFAASHEAMRGVVEAAERWRDASRGVLSLPTGSDPDTLNVRLAGHERFRTSVSALVTEIDSYRTKVQR